jgi:hypothetical protein
MRCLPMTAHLARRFLALVVLVLLSALPALGYRIYLRDGTMLAAQEKYSVEGDFALVTLENGTQTTVRLIEIDLEKTERLNQRAYSSAVVIDGGEQRLLALDDPAMRQRTLAEYVQERRQERTARDQQAERIGRVAPRPARRTLAGSVDLYALTRESDDSEAAVRIAETVRAQGVTGAKVYRGTAPGRYLLDLTAQSDVAVFRALEDLAAAVVELADAGVAIEALEVYMANAEGSRAGMFTLSEDAAALLASDQLEPDQFFLQFVEF